MNEIEDGKFELKPTFIYPSHIGCIKTLGIGGRYLASGSTDEIIKFFFFFFSFFLFCCFNSINEIKIRLYDVHKRVELGSLFQHNGSLTSLVFHKNTHLLSASEDGSICIWRTSDWECLKVLKAHK